MKFRDGMRNTLGALTLTALTVLPVGCGVNRGTYSSAEQARAAARRRANDARFLGFLGGTLAGDTSNSLNVRQRAALGTGSGIMRDIGNSESARSIGAHVERSGVDKEEIPYDLSKGFEEFYFVSDRDTEIKPLTGDNIFEVGETIYIKGKVTENGNRYLSRSYPVKFELFNGQGELMYERTTVVNFTEAWRGATHKDASENEYLARWTANLGDHKLGEVRYKVIDSSKAPK